MAAEYIINVNESDFEYEVLAYSQTVPVVVDFWAIWCIPCRVLEPELVRLTNEAKGSFRLARVDVDENPKLAKRYNIRTVPAVKAINQGQVVSEFTGVLPEPRLREFLRHIAPSPTDLQLEKGTSLLKMHKWQQAEETFKKFLEQNPDNPAASLGIIRAYLAQGLGKPVLAILANFPASPEYNTAILLKPLAEAFIHAGENAIVSDDPLAAAYRNCIKLAIRGNLPAALDGLLDILRQNRRFMDGGVKQVVVSLLEVLGKDDPQTRQYRAELNSIIF
jgi:putative thioredoxin